jgi:hypothetical protein
MRNFYNTKLDLENKKDRVEVLEHNIEKANSQLFKITSTPKDIVSSGGKRENDKMGKLIADIQIWQKELMDLKEDILYLTPYVEKMEKRVNSMVGIDKEVFEGFYCKYSKERPGTRVKILAERLSYSESRIYQILNKVNKELGIKHYKKL